MIFILQGKDTKGAVDGHKVVAKIKTYGTKDDRKPEGVVTEILRCVNSRISRYFIDCEKIMTYLVSFLKK